MALLRVILTGDIPIELFTKIAKEFEKKYPCSIVCDAEHPLSRRYGATLVIITKEDTEMERIIL